MVQSTKTGTQKRIRFRGRGHISFKVSVGRGKTREAESRLVVARSQGHGERGVTAYGYRVSFGGDEGVLILTMVVVA